MKTFSVYSLSALLLLSFFLVKCKKDTPSIVPVVTLSAASNITTTTASSGGTVTADGGAAIIEKGVCWSSTNTTPTTSDSKSSDGTGKETFSSVITGLKAGTTYNLRSYSTNSVGTGYSSVSTFKTLSSIPTVTTTVISLITNTSVVSGGNVSADGGETVTVRGVCWSTNQNPTIANSKTISDGTGTGAFTSSITGLIPNMTYYVRAFATNSIGTSYGTQVTATTATDGQFRAYVFVETNEVGPRNALVDYIASKAIPGSTFRSFMLNSPSQVQSTFDAQMNAWLSYPGWGSSEPAIFSAPISTTSGGFDKYGIYIDAYKFQTIAVPGNTLPDGVYGQFVVLVPISALNGNRYSSIFTGRSAAGVQEVQCKPFADPISSLTISYTGSVNIPKGDYKIYLNNSNFRFPPGASPVYFKGGALIP